MEYIDTATAAARLGVTRQHISHLILQRIRGGAGLAARKFGRDWQITQAEIDRYAATERKAGRKATGQ